MKEYRRKVLVCVFSVLGGFIIYSQASIDTIQLEKGLELAQTGVNQFLSNNTDSAVYYSNLARKTFREIEAWEEYVGTTNNLIFIYTHINQFDKTAELTKHAYHISNLHLDFRSISYADAAANMHQLYYLRGDYNQAITSLKEALVISKKNNASPLDISNIYQNLGSNYSFSGDLQNALLYYKKCLKIQTDSLQNSPQTGPAYQNIARAFQVNNQLDSAVYYYEKAEVVLHPITETNPLISNKIQVNLFLANLWNRKGDQSKARKKIQQTSKIKLDIFHQVLLEETKAKIQVDRQDYDQAITSFQKAQLLADQFNTYNTPPQQARRAAPWAQAHLSIGEFQNALGIYQKALNLLSPNDSLTNEFENPAANQLLDKPDALHLLKGKAAALYDISKNSNGLIHLKAAYQTYKTATQVIAEIRQDILSITSKNSLAESSIPVFEGAIQCALELYVQTNDEKYKAEAFSLAEGNKAMLLLESINDQTAKGFAGIPDSILEKEKTLKSNLSFLKRTLLKINKDAHDTKNIRDQIFKQQQKLEQFTSNLENEFPRYFELKYNNESISLQQAQQLLINSNQLLLEFFYGERNIYLFAVAADDLNIYQINNTAAIKSGIQELRQSLSNHPSRLAAQQSFDQYTQPAHFLYNQLLAPALSSLAPTINKLVIIPDDLLNYLPFGILLTQAPNSEAQSYAAEALQYLLEDYAINYQYSATLLHKSQQGQKKSYAHDFVGFAPSFKNTSAIASRSCIADELYSLQCNVEEINDICTLVNGLSLSGKAAVSAKFSNVAKDYRIVHLATHACVDEENAQFNKIFFTDDYLSNADLYNMEFRAELAVLSACNTGRGKLIKGEGVMSLARGFLNAGCASTVMSMWSVDDCATSDIMLHFYQGLKSGQAKDEALRAAKLNYLQMAVKTKSHPYFWAPFVQFGEVAPIDFKRRRPWGLLSGLGCAIILGLYYWWPSRQN